MLYAIEIKSPPAPIDIIESKEGLIYITSFDELIPFTLRALFQGYGCSSDMLDRLETESSILSYKVGCVDVFITYDADTFAACSTNINRSLRINTSDFLEQFEILDLVESLKGSFKNPGHYVNIKRFLSGDSSYKSPTIDYEPPVFETSLRYLVFLKQTLVVDASKKERYSLVLYLPTGSKNKK